MYTRSDPRFRRTLNQISHNLESANESAQVGLFSVTEHYLKPCLTSCGTCIAQNTATCFPAREDRPRRTRRARPEQSFDFYDDWEEDETDALLSWSNDEHDRLLDASEESGPQRRGFMNYGSQTDARAPRTRRAARGPEDDPTIIPSQSYFGFLERLPFKIGNKGVRYKPSANLLEQPKGKGKGSHDEGEEETVGRALLREGRDTARKRAASAASDHTSGSYSSRGDLFPSDEEDDAIPIDDEFAITLDRRVVLDDASSGKTRGSKAVSRGSSRSRSARNSRRASVKHDETPDERSSQDVSVMIEAPSLTELKQEEQRIQTEEERDVEVKRQTAQRLAQERGFAIAAHDALKAYEQTAGMSKVDVHVDSPSEESVFPQPSTTASPPAETNAVSISADIQETQDVILPPDFHDDAHQRKDGG